MMMSTFQKATENHVAKVNKKMLKFRACSFECVQHYNERAISSYPSSRVKLAVLGRTCVKSW